jgi:hypothetical protein
MKRPVYPCTALLFVVAVFVLTNKRLPYSTFEARGHVHMVPSENQSCPITWVSSYFHIPSKHSHSEYMYWLANLLSMKMCLVLYTDNQEVINMAMQSRAQPHIVIADLRLEAEARLGYSDEFWAKQLAMDPEAEIHQTYMLYWVWALKPHFLNDVARHGVKSSHFIWMDAGVMRDWQYNYRDIRPVQPRMDNHSLYIGIVQNLNDTLADAFCDGPQFLVTDRIAGSIFGGSRAAVSTWLSSYTEVLQRYNDCGWFIGKDQSLMATACLMFQGLCVLLKSDSGNPWNVHKHYILG